MDAPRQTGGSHAVTIDTPITIKITVNDTTKKLKLPLGDLGAAVLPDKLRQALGLKPEQQMTLERYSDSSAGYITLDPNNPHVFKVLMRAAKAKLKLRIRAIVTPLEVSRVEEEATVETTKTVEMTQQPVIVRTPAVARDSTALDGRSVGSGIFQFRDSRASQQTLVNEAPAPRPFFTSQALNNNPTREAPKPQLVFRTREPAEPVVTHGHAWSVYCNACDKAMANEHFHCSICDGGDYDLCEDCIAKGKMCPGEGHWLIKRSIQDGKVVNSTTERIQPTKSKTAPSSVKAEPEAQKEMPGAFGDETKTLAEEPRFPTRTCNSCVIVLPERDFVTCTTCDDFDLCLKCYSADRHGHHPAHGFERATEETILPQGVEIKLAPGRNIRHNAICDGCDKKVYGIRHKCLNCPDWDYCNECIKDARTSHPRHRFAAIYEPIADQQMCMVRHYGIYCDGPLCSNNAASKSFITGVRYKCTICHDTDFCASCEALPSNQHNRTHPLLKLKTPVRHVNITTESEDVHGQVRTIGDRPGPESAPAQQANAATPVQTVAEIKPTEVKAAAAVAEIPTVETKEVAIPVKKFVQTPTPVSDVQTTLLNAHFVKDSVPDGQVFEPETLFTQIWTLKNPGPYAWPAGCSVRYVGGDNMLNVDNSHPASVLSIADATESNVIGREVAVGEEIGFKITLKAPKRIGKSISYWRLKAADGTPFGHRLWCDIEVKKSEPEAVSQPNFMSRDVQMDSLRRQAAELKQTLKQGTEQLARAGYYVPAIPQPLTMPRGPMRLPQPPSPLSEQPPAYDSMNLTSRLTVMREQQKQRREQLVAQLQAQRELSQAKVMNREDMPMWVQHGNAGMNGKAAESMIGKERNDVLKQRVAHMKANILKAREERERCVEELNKAAQAVAEKKASEDETVKSIEVTQAGSEEDEATEADEKLEGSQMVFPKLEKESPASSTYQSVTSHSSKGKAAYVENEQGEVERSAVPNRPHADDSVHEDEDDFESVDGSIEVLSANDEDASDDDGFVTDDEYDILDASDQETVASKHW